MVVMLSMVLVVMVMTMVMPDDGDDGGDGIYVVDGAGIMLTMMVQLQLAKASRRMGEFFTRKYTFFQKRTGCFFLLQFFPYNLGQEDTCFLFSIC